MRLQTFLLPLVSLLLTGVCGAAPSRLNLVLIVADDCTYWDTDLYGGQAKTPNLNRLAEEGMTFSNCYQAAAMCSPTRHALYTSLYPVRSGAYPNHTYVKDGVQSIAHWLRAAGYRAGFSGKTHINPPEAFPFEYLHTTGKKNNPDFDAVDGFLGACVETDSAFGLILCSNEPHTPWNKGDPSAYPPEKLKLPPLYVDTPATRKNFSKYLAEITYFDQQVGEALTALDRHGLRDNTMVVVLTEQGNAFPFAKWTCYDAGLASGLVVRWPGPVDVGSASDALVEYIDILPTFLEAAGIAVPEDLDGRSFLPVLRGESKEHKQCVFGLHSSRGILNGPGSFGIRSVRDERYRYILNLNAETRFTNWATGADWYEEWRDAASAGNKHAANMVNRYEYRPTEELYDCDADPWNQQNLADDASLADTKTRLRSQLEDWMQQQGDLGAPTEAAADARLWKNRSQH